MSESARVDATILSLIAEAVAGKRKAAITREMRLQRDLGIDSIAVLGLIVRFEQAFGLDLSTVDLGPYVGRIRTVDDALAFGREMVQRADAGGPQ